MAIPQDSAFLTILVTGRLLAGRFRSNAPDKTTAGQGNGAPCAVCDRPLRQMKLEAIFPAHRTTGCLVLEAASVSYGKATTHFPVIELLRGYFQIEPRDDVRNIREKVTGKLFSLDRALEAALPALLAILDVPVEDEEWTRLDPPQRRQRTLDCPVLPDQRASVWRDVQCNGSKPAFSI